MKGWTVFSMTVCFESFDLLPSLFFPFIVLSSFETIFLCPATALCTAEWFISEGNGNVLSEAAVETTEQFTRTE